MIRTHPSAAWRWPRLLLAPPSPSRRLASHRGPVCGRCPAHRRRGSEVPDARVQSAAGRARRAQCGHGRDARQAHQPAGARAGQAFDNLYYVGSAWVSAWVLKTSDGLILIDALNNNKEAADLIEGGMRRLGLDPAQIRYVLVTHGHGDHYGGAQMLAERYRARVVASEIDWKMMETGLEFDSKLWDRPPKRDMAVKDGDTLKLGDTTVRFMVTPGHTLGTISPVFDVRQEGQCAQGHDLGRHVVQLRPRHGPPRQLHRTNRTHAPALGAMGHRCALEQPPGLRRHGGQAQGPSVRAKGANPFVSGQPVVDRAMRVLNTCARAQKARFLLTAGGGSGEVYASAAGARESAGHEVAHDKPAAAPVVFPYSAHAGDHDGLCAHSEP